MISSMKLPILIYSTLSYKYLVPFVNADNIIHKAPTHQDTFYAIDSDYFMIDKRPSTLPFENIGSGVFAKFNIPINSIICEHRGFIIFAKDINKFPENDKAHDMTGPDGIEYKNLGDNICAYINDCTAALYRSYTVEEWVALNNSDYRPGVPCIDEFSYNALALNVWGGKIFVVSTREILAGEEIFYPYGWQYWRTRMTIIKNNINHKFVITGNSIVLQPVETVEL